MFSSFFYLQAQQNDLNSNFIQKLETFSDETNTQVYVLDKPLGDSKYIYEYKHGLIVLIPKHKIMILNFGKSGSDEFEDYHLDVVEDLGAISDKYQYKSVIGRTRTWSSEVVYISDESPNDADFSLADLLSDTSLEVPDLQKKTELLISLLTGSINDIERVKKEVPINVLDKIKQKILLFDGEQTRFIYQSKHQKVITIQGLSGTGKTELLLHKLKDLYLNREDSRILFTCHNRILAASLIKRIPDFFNFMKVEQQIKWNERLFCSHAWGSSHDPFSGAYRYICDKYSLVFHRYSYSMPFSRACARAIEELKEKNIDDIGYAFDFVLLDESQDFPKEFIDLCSMVTSESIYVAGDIFQSIFDENIVSEVKPDYLLSNCYRTDPRTLMFAHALGMGLFEEKKLRWLKDDQWGACGYLVEKENDGKIYKLKREPLRRFEELQENNVSSVEIVPTNKGIANSADIVIETIKKIIEGHPTVRPNDIGIVFTGGNKPGFELADVLEFMMTTEFGWELNKAWESKSPLSDHVLISNKNNVKGLEFPFVICLTDYISDLKHERNALYMLLTRSFIKSYLFVPDNIQTDKVKLLQRGLNMLEENGYLTVEAPDPAEFEALNTNIEYDNVEVSVYEMTAGIFDELEVPPLWRDPILNVIRTVITEPDYDSIKELVEAHLKSSKRHESR